jgi:dTDP-4-dehydrorhamnose 3,5-epimerase
MIEGVILKPLITHSDERGYFRELIRVTDEFFTEGFGQWSESLMYQDVIKAWHIHAFQVDWWRVVFGTIKVVLCDRRSDCSTYNEIAEFILDNQVGILRIPPGVAHGCKVLQGPAMLMYITSKVYNPEDEGRIAYDALDYDWLRGPEIK